MSLPNNFNCIICTHQIRKYVLFIVRNVNKSFFNIATYFGSHIQLPLQNFLCKLPMSGKETGNLIGKAVQKAFFLCKNATTSFANLHLNELFRTQVVCKLL